MEKDGGGAVGAEIPAAVISPEEILSALAVAMQVCDYACGHI